MSVFSDEKAQVITHPRQRSQAHYLPRQQQITALFLVGNENHRSFLPGSLQSTCSLIGRSLTLVLVVSVLLEKMAGNEWSVM